MQRIVHPEWRDYHDTTKYPFSDSATLANDDGDFLGESIFIDASLYPIGGTERMYMSKVVVTNEDATIFIGDENTAELASAKFSITTPPDTIQLLDSVGRPAGLIVSESVRLATFQSWSIGTHEFLVTNTEFAARVCVPTPEIGVRGIILEDGTVFADDIWIVGEDGVVVRNELVTVPEEGFTSLNDVLEVIRVDIVGDPLFRRRLCGSVFETPHILRTLTFKHGCEEVACGPDSVGDLKITVGSQEASDTILRIRSVPEGLSIEAVGEKVDSYIEG